MRILPGTRPYGTGDYWTVLAKKPIPLQVSTLARRWCLCKKRLSYLVAPKAWFIRPWAEQWAYLCRSQVTRITISFSIWKCIWDPNIRHCAAEIICPSDHITIPSRMSSMVIFASNSTRSNQPSRKASPVISNELLPKYRRNWRIYVHAMLSKSAVSFDALILPDVTTCGFLFFPFFQSRENYLGEIIVADLLIRSLHTLLIFISKLMVCIFEQSDCLHETPNIYDAKICKNSYFDINIFYV